MNTVSYFAGDIVWKAEIITMLFLCLNNFLEERAYALPGKRKLNIFPKFPHQLSLF